MLEDNTASTAIIGVLGLMARVKLGLSLKSNGSFRFVSAGGQSIESIDVDVPPAPNCQVVISMYVEGLVVPVGGTTGTVYLLTAEGTRKARAPSSAPPHMGQVCWIAQMKSLVEGRRRIEAQSNRVKRLHGKGRDATGARELLSIMEASLAALRRSARLRTLRSL